MAKTILKYKIRSGEAPALPGTPTLPTTFSTSYSAPATTHEVGSGKEYTDLQVALDAAADANANWTLILTAGETFTGLFKLKPKSGPYWTYVISSDLASLPEGIRVAPADDTHMPIITAPVYAGNYIPALASWKNASYYRFCGIKITAPEQTTATVVSLGLGSANYSDSYYSWDWVTSQADCPSYIWFDRCHVTSELTKYEANYWMICALSLAGKYIATIDSYVDNAHYYGDESYAIHINQGEGPYKVVNNFLEGNGMNFFVGGSDTHILDDIPSDIEFRRNYCFKRASWGANTTLSAGIDDIVTTIPVVSTANFASSGLITIDSEIIKYASKDATNFLSCTRGYDGTAVSHLSGTWVSVPGSQKNDVEVKFGKRILIEGNFLGPVTKNSGQQNCVAMSFTTKNQYGTMPWSEISDVTVRYNKMQTCGQGLRLTGTSYEAGGSGGYTDLVAASDHNTSKKVSSAVRIFPADYDGQMIKISGTNWTTGYYTVVTRIDDHTITLDAVAAPNNTTGGTWNECMGMRRILVHDNAFLDINGRVVGNDSAYSVQISANDEWPITDLVIKNNLFLHNGRGWMWAYVAGGTTNHTGATGMKIYDNISSPADGLAYGDSKANGTSALDYYTPNNDFQKNVWVLRTIDTTHAADVACFGGTEPYPSLDANGKFPYSASLVRGWGPDGIPTVEFTTAPAETVTDPETYYDGTYDFTLAAGSPYKGQSTTGGDPGPNWTLLNSYTLHSKDGDWS